MSKTNLKKNLIDFDHFEQNKQLLFVHLLIFAVIVSQTIET